MSLTKTLLIYTETALHAGTGSGLGAVDLPIQREVTTNYPMIQSGGIKGAIRSALRVQFAGAQDHPDINVVFGPEEIPDYAGAASFGDARILAFPVRSLRGVFAWVTSPAVLARFTRDVGTTFAQRPPIVPPEPPMDENQTTALVSSAGVVSDGDDVVLEEYLYRASGLQSVTDWANWLAENAIPASDEFAYYRQAMRERLVVLRDDDFRDFATYATQVITRIRLDRDTKTVVDGALFTQELLPPETLLYVPVVSNKPRATTDALDSAPSFSAGSTDSDVMNWLAGNLPGKIQIGADETVGYGFVTLRWGE